MKPEISVSRRALLRTSTAIAATISLPQITQAAVLTPRATEGPFYPTDAMRFADVDNDLVRIAGQVREAGGEIVRLSGRVIDKDNQPIAGARVEIWQCDVNGRYLHHGDSGEKSRDPAFQGFGYDIADADGTYRFTTIKPVPYPGRTPHIHVKVLTANRTLTTQFYIANSAHNQKDWLFRRMSDAEQRAVEMRFDAGAELPEAKVDIVI